MSPRAQASGDGSPTVALLAAGPKWRSFTDPLSREGHVERGQAGDRDPPPPRTCPQVGKAIRRIAT